MGIEYYAELAKEIFKRQQLESETGTMRYPGGTVVTKGNILDVIFRAKTDSKSNFVFCLAPDDFNALFSNSSELIFKTETKDDLNICHMITQYDFSEDSGFSLELLEEPSYEYDEARKEYIEKLEDTVQDFETEMNSENEVSDDKLNHGRFDEAKYQRWVSLKKLFQEIEPDIDWEVSINEAGPLEADTCPYVVLGMYCHNLDKHVMRFEDMERFREALSYADEFGLVIDFSQLSEKCYSMSVSLIFGVEDVWY